MSCKYELYQDRMTAKTIDMFLEERLTIGEALDFLDAVRRFLLNGKLDYVPIEDTAHENLDGLLESPAHSETVSETTTRQPDGVPQVPAP